MFGVDKGIEEKEIEERITALRHALGGEPFEWRRTIHAQPNQ
ncbi:MAG: hypothetical protein CM15mP49_25660 [Actinomycetota bacterium]|nr:MAG: hypothetical protein CM15mP49_25660 [Actinomycetota bacterium]